MMEQQEAEEIKSLKQWQTQVVGTVHLATGAVGNTDYPAYRNKSGFTALPGGTRSHGGTFYYVGLRLLVECYGVRATSRMVP